jgi:hypothetical protein
MKRILVVGCPRSGTTLVQKLLGARNDVYTCRETHYFQRIRRPGKWKVLDYLMLSQRNVTGAFDFVRTHNELRGEYNPGRVSSMRSAVLFFDRIMTSEAQLAGKVAWVEKTPAHLFHIGWIKRYIPTARFVHVLRDGRDVVASMVDAARKFPQAEAWKRYTDPQAAVEEYNRCLSASLKHSRSEDHVFVQYEHLIEDVELVCDSLYRSLDLAGEMADLDLEGVHGRVVRSDEGWKSDSEGEISDTRLVKFNRMFDDVQKKLIVSSLDVPSPQSEGRVI